MLADTILAPPQARVAAPLRPWYVAAAALVVAVMIAAIRSDSLWFLNFVHVMTGTLWTGIDLFMGFVIGPVLRRVSFETRRAMSAAAPTRPSWRRKRPRSADCPAGFPFGNLPARR